ncbi:MAG: DapH/DapD/GlmU-related protein [Synergistota bacterium]|nr:DapH/DapD/GlmU-related protein [Synergistota bacterium]
MNSIYSKSISNTATILDYAVIYENVQISHGVTIGEHNVIGKVPTPTSIMLKNLDLLHVFTTIGENCRLCSHVTVYSNVVIGDNCLLGDNVSIFTDVKIGKNVIISRNVTINSETEIGNNVRIMDGSHVTGRTIIGDSVFISTGVFMANDNLFGKKGFSIEARGPIIEDYVSIGAGATLLPNITIGSGSIISAGSVVKKNVPAGVVVAGNPAKVIAPVPNDWDRRPSC